MIYILVVKPDQTVLSVYESIRHALELHSAKNIEDLFMLYDGAHCELLTDEDLDRAHLGISHQYSKINRAVTCD